MIFYTLPWSRWNRTHKLWNTCVVPFAIDQLGQMFWCSTHTKIWTRQQLYHCTQRLNHEDISMLCLLTPLAVIKDVKIVKNQDAMSMSMSLTVRCQNLIGSYTSTHSSFNLIGPRKKISEHTNPQRYVPSTDAQTSDRWAIYSSKMSLVRRTITRPSTRGIFFQQFWEKKQEVSYQGHPTSIFGKYLFGRRFEI